MTVDEIRALRGLKPLGKKNGGNMVLNSVMASSLNVEKQMQAQQEMEAQQENDDLFAKAFEKYLLDLKKAV